MKLLFILISYSIFTTIAFGGAFRWGAWDIPGWIKESNNVLILAVFMHFCFSQERSRSSYELSYPGVIETPEKRYVPWQNMISPLQKTKENTQNARKTKVHSIPSFRVWQSSLTWPFLDMFHMPNTFLTTRVP
jgi:hypothetical protein